MFKRSGALLLTLLYTVTVMGFALNLHYCFSHITSVQLDAPVKSCSMNVSGKMKCCQDKHIEVKVKDAHEAGTSSILSKLFGFEIPRIPFLTSLFAAQQGFSDDASDSSPPDPPVNPLVNFLKNCVFRI